MVCRTSGMRSAAGGAAPAVRPAGPCAWPCGLRAAAGRRDHPDLHLAHAGNLPDGARHRRQSDLGEGAWAAKAMANDTWDS
jgi:hypothetical protein